MISLSLPLLCYLSLSLSSKISLSLLPLLCDLSLSPSLLRSLSVALLLCSFLFPLIFPLSLFFSSLSLSHDRKHLHHKERLSLPITISLYISLSLVYLPSCARMRVRRRGRFLSVFLLNPLMHARVCAGKGRAEGGKSSSPSSAPPRPSPLSSRACIRARVRGRKFSPKSLSPFSSCSLTHMCVHEFLRGRGWKNSLPSSLSLFLTLLRHQRFLCCKETHATLSHGIEACSVFYAPPSRSPLSPLIFSSFSAPTSLPAHPVTHALNASRVSSLR